MALAAERSSSSSVAMRTPEKRPSRATTDTGTSRTIGRSRRRRPISTPSSSSNTTTVIEGSDGKENISSHRSRRKADAATITPMRSRDKTNRNYLQEEEEPFGSFETEKVPLRHNYNGDYGERTRFYETACRDFQKALLRTSVPSPLWRDFPKLAQTLVRISISKSSTTDSLGLDGHVSALLGFSRKLIKDVSVEASGDAKGQQKRKVSVQDNLFVAVHILRSIAFGIPEDATIERKEALLKMFFHLISSTRSKTEEGYKSIALAGYEGLGKVMSSYSIRQSRGEGKEDIVSFKQMQSEKKSSHDSLNERILFVVPSTARRKKTNSDASSRKAGSMSTRQLSTIAFQTTMVVAKAILSLKDNTSLLYGNLGIALSGINSGEESTVSNWHRIALELLQQVHEPWLSLLAGTVMSDREAVKEILSYAKGIHRMLWDAASTLKSSSTSSNNAVRKVEHDCLELRKKAILHLLAGTGTSKLDLLIRKTYFESGCTYAWKAGSVFAQHLSSGSDTDKTLLTNFYEDLDTAFARLVALDPHVPMGFVEYKVNRSLHLESVSSFFGAMPDVDEVDTKEDDVLNGNYRILLHIMDIGISCKARIKTHFNNSRQQSSPNEIESATSFDSLSVLEQLIYEFNWQVIHRMDEIASDPMNRILKALCNLSLHKTLFLAIQHIDSDKASSLSDFTQLETDLQVVATVLTECLGPLVSAYLNHNPKKVPQLADLMMECFLRPLSLYEQLRVLPFDSEDGARRYLEASTSVSKYVTEILTDDSMRPDEFVLPIQCLEKAAKLLYTIARQRNESSHIQDAVLPLLFSLKLYDKLDSLNGGKKDYQLPSRLFLLSSVFQSMGKVNESFFVRCLLIDYESEKHSIDLSESSEEENLLTYFGAKSSGLLPPPTDDVPVLPQIIRSMCRQMVIDMIEAEASYEESEVPHSFDHFSIVPSMELFLVYFTGETTNIRVPHPLESIEQLLKFDRIISNESRIMHIFALTEILIQLGKSIQQLSRGLELNESQLDSLLHNYSHLNRLLEETISNLQLECPCVFGSLLGLVASASIVPSFCIAKNAISPEWEKGVNPMLIEVATAIADSNTEELQPPRNYNEECDNEVNWVLLVDSLHIALKNFGVMLRQKTSETNCDDDIFDDCIGTMKRLVAHQDTNRKSNIVRKANFWTIWVAGYLQNELRNRGDHDRAAVFSLWTLALAEKIQPNQPWFLALAMTACTNDCNLLRLTRSFSNSAFDENSTRGSTLWMFEKEYQLCELRFAALRSLENGQNSFHVYMHNVENILAELTEFAVERNDILYVLYTWVLSTAYLVQTDIASTFGCFTIALKATQMCQKCCQMIMRRVSVGASNFDEWMAATSTSSVLAMASHRYIEMISIRSKLHYRLGDHRKALAYTRYILEYVNIDPVSLTSQEGGGYLPEHFKALLETTPRVRIFLQMNSWASTPEITMQQFSGIEPEDLVRQQSDDSDQTTSSIVHSIQDLITIGDLLHGESFSKQFNEKKCAFYDEAATLISQRANNLQIESLRVPLDIEQHLGMPVIEKVKLRGVRRMLESSHKSNQKSDFTIRQLCSQIEGSESASPEDKAWALYYAGVLDMEAARCSGALQELWDDDEIDQISTSGDDENIRSARYHLARALLHSSKASDILLRNILRSLALVEGPNVKDSIGSSAGILILRSIGQSLRRKLKWSFDQDHESSENEAMKNLKDIFNVFDGPFQSEEDRDDKINFFLLDLAAHTSENWKFVAPVICPSGEMLVTVLQKKHPSTNEFTISTKCIFPPRGDNAYDEIMKPLDSILSRMQQQLEGVDPSHISKSNDKEAIKRKWWDERNRLDGEMRNLLEDVESLYFSNFFDIESGNTISPTCNSTVDLEEFPRGDLSSRFEAAVNDSFEHICNPEGEHQEKIDILMKLTIPKIKDRLLSVGASKSQFRKLRKADLIELLIQIEDDIEKKEKRKEVVCTNNSEELEASDACLFLILDENLHRFPFEGMPMLKGKTVCRIPCLSFVLATLREIDGGSKPLPSVNPEATSYILNPENNLQATQDRLLPVIQDFSSSGRWDWDGVIGEIPPSSFFSEALCRKDGLVMYFGHGGAQVCFSRRKVDDLIEHRGSDTQTTETNNISCRATVLLMGCSSGKLISINRKHSNSIEEAPLYYEPEGVALSYLCAGAPCVIGNLWDVTDNDIDRFSIALMEDFFNENTESKSLAQSLSISRSVCKLKHLVGCAPVCYGVPVYLQRK